MMSEKPTRNKKGSTCRPCRQLKLKCDSAEKYPDSCSRCLASGKGSECAIDPTFRRVTNKQHISDLQNEIHKLRREVQKLRTSSPLPEGRSNENAWLNTARGSSVSGPENLSSPGESINGIEEQNIDNVHLSSRDVNLLIAEYYTHFHPHFPILPEMPTFVANYDKNALLLWTVLAVAASKQSTDLAAVYPSLVDPVRSLAADLYDAQSRTLETAQALLLICMWPFPFQKTANDPSLMYTGVAIQVSYQLGLHRPGFGAEFDYGASALGPEDDFVRRKTWLGCFIVNQSIALKSGIPSAFGHPGYALVSELAKGTNSDLPKSLLVVAHVLYHSQKAITALGDEPSIPDGLLPTPGSLVQSYGRELVMIKQQYQNDWNDTLDIIYLDIQLQVASFELMKNRGAGVFLQPDQALLEKSIEAIHDMVKIATSRIDESKSWPMHLKYSMFYAAALALKIVVLKDAGDKERLKLLHACRSANQLIKSWKSFGRDNFTRFSTYLETVSLQVEHEDNVRLQKQSFTPGVLLDDTEGFSGQLKYTSTVRCRMATSAVYDVMWTGRKIMKRADIPTLDDNGDALPALLASTSDPTESSVLAEPMAPDSMLDSFAYISELQYPDTRDIWMDWQTLRESWNPS